MADVPQSTPRAPYAPEEPKPSIVSNILAIVGFIILIVVVIWGLVHLTSISRSWFSSLFGKSETAIEVTAPESAASGAPFTVSWKYDEPTSGTYAFLYQCESGLQFQTPGPAGILNTIPCGAAFTVPSEEKILSMTPILSGAEPLDVPLSIIFMPSATSTSSGQATRQARGSATVKISPAPLEITTPAPAPTPTTPTPTQSPTPAPVPKTPADLSVRIISVNVDASGQGVATFDIANVGGTSSGTYYFSAQLPVSSGGAYSSSAQTSLAPGAHIVNTLRFSQAVSGTFSVSITTPDANQSNNYASQTMSASYYGSYNYPYNYTAYPYYNYTQTGNYPYQLYQQPYTTYQYVPGYGYTNVYQSPYQQYPSPYAPGYSGTPYSQQYPYSTYYPYAY